jgi:hypothetical protein
MLSGSSNDSDHENNGQQKEDLQLSMDTRQEGEGPKVHAVLSHEQRILNRERFYWASNSEPSEWELMILS